MDRFDEIFLWSDTDIIPSPGNFSFIKNSIIRKSLEFDYSFFNQIDGWEVLKIDKKIDINFWNILKLSCYPGHTDKSYRNSLFYLEFICIHGWSEFVIMYITYIESLKK